MPVVAATAAVDVAAKPHAAMRAVVVVVTAAVGVANKPPDPKVPALHRARDADAHLRVWEAVWAMARQVVVLVANPVHYARRKASQTPCAPAWI